MRVSEKGQITLPKALRDAAGIAPNSEVRISFEGGRLIVEPTDQANREAIAQRIRRFNKALDALTGTGDPSISTDDVMDATRG
ncbi:AbrB/MazE/SpoVT family DNA-binding domain-containing protein [Notoacmeibacter sp. MSK16QG-6]|uniref:AbrB/MazE/SpoVT family DNA-binding domain-containing protein n=1 Tax=Notoacmeibacter sp. MSK16QG-6 TaxID=2957982 RepID=UPI0020A14986|nr:AbrB/MazE/SpoVT family DNA-binding domain-containing protein [Notoacmeibacter sp. MSK16QG-6]